MNTTNQTVATPDVAIYPNRRESFIMKRLRIGQTRLTHSYYMIWGRPHEYYDTFLTAKHILKCKKYANLRRKHNLPKDMMNLLGPNCPKDEIMLFLKEVGILEEIWRWNIQVWM